MMKKHKIYPGDFTDRLAEKLFLQLHTHDTAVVWVQVRREFSICDLQGLLVSLSSLRRAVDVTLGVKDDDYN